jgi:hypothetical protein
MSLMLIAQTGLKPYPTFENRYLNDRTFLFGSTPCYILKEPDSVKHTITLRIMNGPLFTRDNDNDIDDNNIVLKYYTGNEKELYDIIRNNKEVMDRYFIKNLVVDSLVTDSTTVKGRKIVGYPMIFSNSIIQSFTEPFGYGPDTHKNDVVVKKKTKQLPDSLIFKKAFIFMDCVLDFFTLNNSSFEKEVILDNCLPIAEMLHFKGGGNYNFKKCQFYDNVKMIAFDYREHVFIVARNEYVKRNRNTIDDGTDEENPKFIGKVNALIDSNKYISWAMQYAVGRKPSTKPDSLPSYSSSYTFENCKFLTAVKNEKCVTIQNTDKYDLMEFDNCEFRNKICFFDHHNEKSSADYFTNFNIQFNSANFLDNVDFTKADKYINCINQSSHFRDTLFLNNSIFLLNDCTTYDSAYLYSSNFAKTAVIVMGNTKANHKNFPRIHSLSLQNLTLLYDEYLKNAKSVTELDLQDYNTFKSNLQQSIASIYPEKIAGVINDKLEHEYLLIEADYNKENFWRSIGSANRYLKFYFLELTVQNGYNGEGTFFSISLFIFLFFSLIYFSFHRRDVVNFVIVNYENAPAVEKARPTAINYCRCFWVSCVILINPKFPATFFKEKPRLFALFTIQWVIGLIMVILFLVYIASKYPILNKITGL